MCSLLNRIDIASCEACGTYKTRRVQQGATRASKVAKNKTRQAAHGVKVDKPRSCPGTLTEKSNGVPDESNRSTEPNYAGKRCHRHKGVTVDRDEASTSTNIEEDPSPGEQDTYSRKSVTDKNSGTGNWSRTGLSTKSRSASNGSAAAKATVGRAKGRAACDAHNEAAQPPQAPPPTSEAVSSPSETQPSPMDTDDQMEHHSLHRRSVAAAVARSTLAKLRGVDWRDVAIDWCPEEKLEQADAAICNKLRIGTLSKPIVTGKAAAGSGVHGRDRTDRCDDDASTVAAAADDMEIRMEALFPLPPPAQPQYVKKGLYCLEAKDGADRSEASANNTNLPPQSTSEAGSREENDGLVQVPTNAVAAIADPGGTTPASCETARCPNGRAATTNQVAAGNPASQDRTADAVELPAAAVARAEGSRGAGARCTEPRTATATATATATGDGDSQAGHDSGSMSLSASERGMSLAERSKAYNAIFRNRGQHQKKRPRNASVGTRLRLPLPMAPKGLGPAAEDLAARPPCGGAGDVQTEEGAEWAWGLLSEGAGGGGGVGPGEGGNGNPGGAFGFRDFRLPYDVLYDERHEEFQRSVAELGVRSVQDATEEFESISSNVYLTRKVRLLVVLPGIHPLPRLCRPLPCPRPADGWVLSAGRIARILPPHL